MKIDVTQKNRQAPTLGLNNAEIKTNQHPTDTNSSTQLNSRKRNATSFTSLLTKLPNGLTPVHPLDQTAPSQPFTSII